MSAAKILIVDDEAPIREMLRMALELKGFECIEADSAAKAQIVLVDEQPQLILLDWMMPKTSGVEWLRRLRKDPDTAAIPVIMLTAKDDEGNKISGLEAGSDDYITKPFSPRELIARVEALLRRSGFGLAGSVVEFGSLKVDTTSYRAFVDGEEVKIGPTEFKMLAFFVSNVDRAYSREQLLDKVWGHNVYLDERTVDVHIRRLRKALDSGNGTNVGGYIQTVRGKGYRFSPHH